MVARRGRSSPTPPTTPASNSRISLPQLVVDPVWSLKPWPVVMDLAGQELVIPAMCAADWLQILMDPELQPDDIMPGLLNDSDNSFVEDLLHSGALSWEESQLLALEIVGQVAGRPWWVALRLIGTMRASWDALGGDMVMKADASRLTLSGWLDAAFLLIVRAIEDSKRTMWLMKLEMPPAGHESEAKEPEMSTDAFLALMH